MTNKIEGRCHCGNLSFELLTETAPADIKARACDCRFCRIHAAQNWSDPHGSMTIHIVDARQLQKYRFALRTADFYVCRSCGAYLAAVLADKDGTWSTVNLRLSDVVADEEIASYGKEDTTGRVARRKKVWTPTTITVGHIE